MIIQSLCRYYDILAGDEDAAIARPGYSSAKVSFGLVLGPGGELSYIVDLRSDDKKPRPKVMDVPLQTSRAVSIVPYVLCDNAKYVFGVEKFKRGDFEKKFLKPSGKGNSPDYTILAENEKEVVVVHQRSRDCFEAFKMRQHEVFDTLDDPGVRALFTFLDSWKPEEFCRHPKIAEYLDDLLAGGSCVFECDGVFLHRKPSVKGAWEHYCGNNESSAAVAAQCLVTGKVGAVARIHQNLKGVAGAQMSGASLVSFNDDSFCSYGKKQSFNAPISESAMFKYTTALNYLLAHTEYRQRIADTTVVYWAETSGTACENLASLFFAPPETVDRDSSKDPTDPERVQDWRKIELIGGILEKVRKGRKIHTEDVGADPETNFYMLGLAPNNARLAVRFWHVGSFGNFIERAARHHLDMEIVRGDYDPRYVSMYRLLEQTVAAGSDNKAASPLLGGLLLRSILNGTPYPVQMYTAMINRAKVERSVNAVRAGFIKAYLLRLARAGLTNLQEEMITVSLNEENPNVPYRLGRLFAVLEKAQTDTNREMKSTINSKYFSSASTTPAVVFPVLLKLAQHHIAKSDWGFKTTQDVEETLAGVDEFPAYLNLEEQGMFMLGYYHQRKAFYKKKEEVAGEGE
ncbi:type I-C CRISPR-associated protein Cas8c/Csd1 [Methanoculleus sp. FWC-SCC1]|uniref:Type I-C CRISPR-associated protein Cas8c/Csd1 n=1 Tax=Methanoculleus frigidifontis TaxID=2584085 RepID=A0ABT8MDL6_9EURY|nr:type I-C CRISPR-associated protein Cas8c/Csd1 [Methanoculleus sp. FWC-SCC1]MDN7026035.1 type I-C CRISPR-associated protein Cas8c/Csd1 [Methanoculleus sp. FWC-SCC1]